MVRKCVNCGEKMLATYMTSGFTVYICPHVTIHKPDKFSGAIYCDAQPTFKEKNVRLFKEQLKSKLVKMPLPKEDYKRIEKEIRKLEQADVNDILYTLQNEEKNLKKQMEMTVRESIDVSTYVQNAYKFYTFTFILRKFADKVGLEIGWPKDPREFMREVVKASLR